MLGASGSKPSIDEGNMNQDTSSLPSDNNVSSKELDDEVPF